MVIDHVSSAARDVGANVHTHLRHLAVYSGQLLLVLLVELFHFLQTRLGSVPLESAAFILEFAVLALHHNMLAHFSEVRSKCILSDRVSQGALVGTLYAGVNLAGLQVGHQLAVV